MELEVKLLLIAVWLTPADQQNLRNICSCFWTTLLKSPVVRSGTTGPSWHAWGCTSPPAQLPSGPRGCQMGLELSNGFKT